MSPVYRLARSWALLERNYPREHALLAPLQALTSSASNWAIMRQVLFLRFVVLFVFLILLR